MEKSLHQLLDDHTARVGRAIRRFEDENAQLKADNQGLAGERDQLKKGIDSGVEAMVLSGLCETGMEEGESGLIARRSSKRMVS